MGISEHNERGNNQIVDEVLEVRKKLQHWFSLLFAISVQTLQWREEPDVLRPMHESEMAKADRRPCWSPISADEECQRIYIHAFTSRRERLLLGQAFDKITGVIQWIEHEVSRLHLFGRVYMHSSILSRVSEELSSGALAFCEAHTIAFVPFPFLFAQVLSYALYTFSLLCPFIVQASLQEQTEGLEQTPTSWPALIVMNTLLVTGFSCLNEIATELEDPFREKTNNFPLRILQRRLDWSMESATGMTVPKDFDVASFSSEVVEDIHEAETTAMKNALYQDRRQPTASMPGLAVANACEELRLSLAECVGNLENDDRELLRITEQMELDLCRLAYEALLRESVTNCPGAGVAPVAQPSPDFASEVAWDPGQLHQILEESASLNRKMSPLLIQDVCFQRG